MNTLGYRSTNEHGLSFELLIDGKPLSELIGSQHTPIPFWLFESDLPYYLPRHSPRHNPEIRIVAVCSCGQYGCGRATCRVVHGGDAVVFCDFWGNLGAEERLKGFRFSPVNYSSVVLEIVTQVNEYKSRA